MASLSSSQSGNWSSSSTWGGVTPADGDTFTVNRGHKVTVNSNVTQSNGYGDIAVYGNLHLETNAYFRLNGRITVYGQDSGTNYNSNKWFSEGDNTTAGLLSTTGSNVTIEVRGTNADQHGIWVIEQRFASMKLDADEKKTTTHLATSASVSDTYITVDSTTGFAKEDWIAVYRDGEQDDRVQGDEGFWVHDVDSVNDRLYIRQFVSPTAVISSTNGSTVVVDNSKVFRKNYKVIFGTGTNRNVKTITNIDYRNHILYFDSSVTGTVNGETIYQTGVEVKHVLNDAVQKIATTLTTAITTADSTDQITVGSADDISVGDQIIIDVNNDSDFGFDYNSQYTVTAKSGNTLTLDDQVRHLHKVGSLVNILSRHVTIKGVDTSTDTRPFLYVTYWTDYNNAHTRHIRLKNVRFTQWGVNTYSTYYNGVMIAGYNSEYRDDRGVDGRFQFQSKLQGCVIDNCNHPNTGYYAGFTLRHPYGFVFRNNTAYYVGNYPFWQWSSQHNVKWYNNYSTRSSYTSHYTDAVYEEYSDTAYNYYTRSQHYGVMMHQNRENTIFRHLILLNHQNRAFYMYYNSNNLSFYRIYMDGYRYFPHHGEPTGPVNWIDCYFGNRWYKNINSGQSGLLTSTDYLAIGGPPGKARYDRNTGGTSFGAFYEFNHEYDSKGELYGGGIRLYDVDQTAWKIVHMNASDYPVFISSVFVPANTVVRISSFFKGENNSNYTFPYLFAKQQIGGSGMGRYLTDYTNQTSFLSSSDTNFQNSSAIGFREQTQFTAACKGAWEEKQLTIQAKTSSYMLIYGMHMNSNNSQEIGYMRDISVYLDTPTQLVTENMPGKRVRIRDGFTPTKKRISGRI